MATGPEALKTTREVPSEHVARPRDYIAVLRPAQWVKNIVVFAGPAAGMRLFSIESFTNAAIAFSAFCLAASATYAINDVVDRTADAKHPTKRLRPIARGAIAPVAAVVYAVLLVLAAFALTVLLPNRSVSAVLGCYMVMTVSYSLGLKRRMILDVILIATGFVLRAWAGSLAVGVPTSEWLVACIFTLCLFMGFGKRRCEIAVIGNAEDAGQHRRTLLRYTPQLLTHLISVSAGMAVVTFLIYTMDRSGGTVPFQKEQLFYTLPVVVYGIFRFAMLTEVGDYSGPTEIVLKDKGILAAVSLWIAAALVIVYQKALFGEQGLSVIFGGQ